jgi:hypothetical protein
LKAGVAVPLRTEVIERRPIYHYIPSLSQPLNPKKDLVKTKLVVLPGPIISKVIIVIKKKIIYIIPPIISTTLSNLRAKILKREGRTR